MSQENHLFVEDQVSEPVVHVTQFDSGVDPHPSPTLFWTGRG